MTTEKEMFNFDQDAFDELEDFESEDFWRPSRRASTDYLDRMWGQRGFGRTRMSAENIAIAHGMVESFLNAFARDGRYVVTFDAKMPVAGTDMNTRMTTITPAPILDPTLTPEEAGRILTALAVHEISHPRYGRDTFTAVSRVFPQSAAAQRISNILDDVRIEMRYEENYPGYAGIFEPARQYVGRGVVKRNGDAPMQPRISDQLNLMTAALRYEEFADWDGVEDERDWWKAWCERWSREDAPRRHIQAIREALQHIVAAVVESEAQKGSSEGESASGEAGETGEATNADEGSDSDEESRSDEDLEGSESDLEDDIADGASNDADASEPDAGGLSTSDAMGDGGAMSEVMSEVEKLSDSDLGHAADSASVPPRSSEDQFPECTGTAAIERAAQDAGVSRSDINDSREEAQEMVEEQKLLEDNGRGEKVSVARSLRGLIHKPIEYRASTRFRKSDLAARYIRDALMMSRSGHRSISRYRKRGRLDQQGIHRIAHHDFRLFERRHAPSPGKYLMWMMLDRSSSMDGWPSVHAAQVATAIADALQYVDSMRAAVWAWTNNFRSTDKSLAGVARVWQTGQNTSEIAKSADLPGWGTPDSSVLSWAWRAILKEAHVGETPVIVFCSDGFGYGDMNDVVAEARDAGVIVISVALGGLNEDAQRVRFGEGRYVVWQGSILATAKPLAKMIMRVVTGGLR